MVLSIRIKPISDLKSKSAQIVAAVTRDKAPVVITQSGEAKVVIQDVASYEADKRTLLMLKLLAQGASDADAGRVTDHDELFDQLEKKLSRRIRSKKAK